MTEILPGRWVDLIANADSIECFLICPDWKGSGTDCTPLSTNLPFHPYAVRQFGGFLTKEEKTRLKKIVLDPGSYLVWQGLGGMKPCVPNYNVAYHLIATEKRSDRVERVMLWICHSCAYLKVQFRGNNITLDVDYAADELLEFSKHLFPNDPETAALYERHHGHYYHSQRKSP